MTENMDKFELGIALQKVYDFIWDEFCDWYIEFVKTENVRCQGESEVCRGCSLGASRGAENALKLLHPFMPFVTEEIYSKLIPEEESLMMSKWPEYREDWDFPQAENIVEHLKRLATGVRNVRAGNECAGRKEDQDLCCQ